MSSQTIGTARVDIVANADGVEVAAAKAKTSIANMSTSAQQQYENLTKRQQRSIETLMRQVDTVGMAREEQLAYNVAMRTTGALQQELLGRLKASQSGFQQQASAMKYGELSAKQYAAAMRGVPAQITDIAVSLQGGQRPLTVFLQQGGQLKDMFGGVVPAARALSSTFLGMINPVTVLGAGVTALGVAWYQGSRELDGLNQHLIMTGNSIGLTTNQVSEMAMELDRLPGITRSGAAEALTQITRTGKIAGEQLALVSEVALQANRLLGKEVSATVEEFAKLAEDPVKSVMELNKQYNFLTLSVYDQIRALEEQGRTQDAATLATETMASVTLERLSEVESSQGYLQKGWGIVTTTAKEAWDAMLGIGRVKTGSEIADAAQQSIDTALRTLESLRLSEVTTYAEIERSALSGANKAAAKDALAIIQQAEQKLEDLRREQAGADFTASAQSFASKQVEEEHARREALEKLLEDGRTRQQIYADEVAAEKKRWESISAELEVGSAQYQAAENAHLQIIKNIDEKFKERAKGRSGASAYQTEMARLQARAAEEQNLASALAQSGSQFERLNEFERRASQLRNLAATETKASTKAEYERLATLNEQVGAQVRANKATEDAIKERNRYLDGLEKSVKQTKEEALRISDQAKTVGLSRTAIEELTTARLREKAAQLQGIAGSEAELELLNQQIAARAELVKAISQHEVAQATYEAQQESIQEWEKTVDQYGDVFRQGFADMLNNGKDGWKSFTTSLVTTFKTSVADQIYKMFAQPFVARVALGVGGVLGGGAAVAAQGAGGGFNVLGGLSGVNSLANAFSGGVVNSLSSAIGGLGNAFGSSALTSFASGMAGTLASTSAAGISAIGSTAAASLGTTVGTGALGATAYSSGMSAAALGAKFAAVAPWLAGAGALVSIGSMLHNAFKGETRVGGGFWQDSATGQTHFGGGPSGGYGGQKMLSTMDQVLAGFSDSVTGLFDALDVSAELIRTTASFESSDKGRGGTSSGGTLLVDGQTLHFGSVNQDGGVVKGAGYGGTSGSAEEMFEAMTKDMAYSTLEAWQLVADKMPPMLSDMLRGVDVRSLGVEQAEALAAQMHQVVGSVNALSMALNQLPMSNLKELAFEAKAGLNELFGGVDQAVAGLGMYYQEFYTEAERAAHTTQLLTAEFGRLGYELPASRDALRELVDGVDLSTREGQELYVQLIQMAPAFASVTEAVEDLGETLTDVSELMRLLSTLPFNHLRSMGEEAVRVLADLSGGVDVFGSNLSGYYQGFFSEHERFVMASGQLASELSGLGVSLPATADGFRSMMDSIDLTTQAGQELFTALLRTADQAASYYRYVEREQQSALADLAKQVQDAQQKELDAIKAAQKERLDALRAQQADELAQLKDQQSVRATEMRKSHEKQVKAVRTSYDNQVRSIRDAMSAVNDKLRELSSLSRGVKSSLDSLRGFSDLAVDLHRTASKGLVEDAIRLASSGHSLAGMAGLEDAVSAVGRLEASNFSSLFEYERERAESVQALKQLSSLTDGQVSVQDMQLAAMEKQLTGLEEWRTQQLDLLSHLSEVEQEKLQSLFEQEREQLKQQSDLQLSLMQKQHEEEQASFLAQVDLWHVQEQERLSKEIEQFHNMHSLQEAANDIFESEGLKQRAALQSVQDAIDASAGLISSAVSNMRVSVSLGGENLPAFADGGYYRGGLALVGEKGPEIINFSRPGMVYTAAQSKNLMAGGDNQALIEEIRRLRAEVSQLRADQMQNNMQLVKNTLRTSMHTETLKQSDSGDDIIVVY